MLFKVAVSGAVDLAGTEVALSSAADEGETAVTDKNKTRKREKAQGKYISAVLQRWIDGNAFWLLCAHRFLNIQRSVDREILRLCDYFDRCQAPAEVFWDGHFIGA